MAAVFGYFIKTRNRVLKNKALSAGITAIFGITEPAIYGVTLRFKKPFVCGCIDGAVGAIVVSLFGSLYYAFAALPGLFTLANAISPDAPMSFIGEVVGCAVAIVLTIVLVQIVGFDDPINEDMSTSPMSADNLPKIPPTTVQPLALLSPVNGEVIALSDVGDEVFSQKLLGDGVNLMGYTPWGCIDLVSFTTGEMAKRYGFIYVDKQDDGTGTLARKAKKSFHWYQKVIASNGETL